MKIGIITFHFVSNQGALLQCYALQKFLENNGHEVAIINYRPLYHTVRYSGIRNPYTLAKWYYKKFKVKGSSNVECFWVASKRFARCVLENATGKNRKQAKVIDNFINRNFHLTQTYKTYRSLKNNPPVLDCYISGSDQLWNPELLNQEYDPAYFLKFGGANTTKISYAVSFGKEPTVKEQKQLRDLCSDFNAISVREYNAQAIGAIEREVHTCIDPTLLLIADDYAELESNLKINEPYIFVYGFETNEAVRAAVDAAKEKYNCKVINGSPHRVFLDCESDKIIDYAPDIFLSYIKNAQCVVTNSFHATAFSIIYKKDFITVPHSTRSMRMVQLLKNLGIEGCLWKDKKQFFENNINYNAAYEKLAVLRQDSISFLNNAIRKKTIPEYVQKEQEISSVPENQFTERITKVFSGYFKDPKNLQDSTSGGAATALAEEFIRHGGVVFGTAYTSDFYGAEYVRIDHVEDLNRIKGSKYITNSNKIRVGNQLKSVFEVVGEELQKSREVLFIGLGCGVAALKKYIELQKIEDKYLYTIDLICHGPMFDEIQKKFIQQLEDKYHSKVCSFSSRYKKHGWTPPYIHVVFENGKVYDRRLYESDYGYAFKVYSRESCFACQFKGKNHPADITLGDHWGLREVDDGFNRNGVSVLISHTAKGDSMIEGLSDDVFQCREVGAEKVLKSNRMYANSRNKPVYYDQFVADFKTNGLHYAVVQSPGYKNYLKIALKKRIRAILK